MIIKVEKYDTPFVQIDKRPLEDPHISWKAKGILAYLLSRPNDWQVRLQDLANRSADGVYAIRSGLAELENVGYAEKIPQDRRPSGRFGPIDYIIREQPLTGCGNRIRTVGGYPLAVNRIVTNNESTNIKDPGKSSQKEDFSDILSPRERHDESSPYDLAYAEKKASMTTEQFASWRSLGGGPQLRQEMGETAWTVPIDAKTDELDGDFLVAEFCAHLEIDPKVLPTKTKKAWKRQLTKPAVERNIPFEGALKALRFTLNFQIGPLDWMRRGGYDPIISKPAHPKFLEAYESMLLKEASGTLESFIERRRKNGVRSSSGRAAQGGGPSEDARRRGRAVESIVERRRREAEQEMLSLWKSPDSST